MPPRDHFRAFARRKVDLAARLSSDLEGWERSARIVNLSLGGACIEVDVPLQPDSVVRLQVLAPHLWDPLVLHASVCWVASARGGTRAGLAFEHRRASSLRVLVEFVGASSFD